MKCRRPKSILHQIAIISILFIILISMGAEPVSAALSYLDEIDLYFMVGLADLTLGYNHVAGQVEPIESSDDFTKGWYLHGRLAFYLKGKILGKYLITAQIDTGETANLLDKEGWKRSVDMLRHIDPEKYYPVYGDSSSVASDVNSWGKLYFLMQWDQSEILWGTFPVGLTDTKLIPYDRTLYGLKANFQDDRSDLHLFRAEPGTIHTIDRVKSGGTLLYYLSHGHIIRNTENLKLEVIDRITGEVGKTVPLEVGRDYQIDHVSGRVVLLRELWDLTQTSYIEEHLNLTEEEIMLVAEYEYDTRDQKFKQIDHGVSLKHVWTEHADIILNYVQGLKQDGKMYKLYGLDWIIKFDEHTYLEMEWANSESYPDYVNFSDNGGLTYTPLPVEEPDSVRNAAYAKFGVQLPEPTDELAMLNFTAEYKYKEKGFASESEQAKFDTNLTMINLDGETVEGTRFKGKILSNRETGGKNLNLASVQASKDFLNHYTLTGLTRYQKLSSEQLPTLSDTLAGLQLLYRYDEQKSLFVSQQYSIYNNPETPKNHRLTIGGEWVFHNVELKGDFSKGSLGDEVHLESIYHDGEEADLLFSVKHGKDIAGGTTTRTRYRVVAHTEDDWDVYLEHADLVSTYEEGWTFLTGVEYRPFEEFTMGVDLAKGSLQKKQAKPANLYYPEYSSNIFDDLQIPSTGFFDKGALTVRFIYDTDELDWIGNAQLSQNNADSLQLLAKYGMDWYLENELTAMVDVHGSYSINTETDELIERHVEGNLGIAYRPVKLNRLNLLLKYTFLELYSPDGQIDGTKPNERANIFTLDGVYDLTSKLQLTEKLGYKGASIILEPTSPEWYQSNTYLWINRLGYSFAPDWQAYGELRGLWNTLAADRKLGSLLGVNWRINNTTSLQFGYNFTDFNDDLKNLNNNSNGLFLKCSNVW